MRQLQSVDQSKQQSNVRARRNCAPHACGRRFGQAAIAAPEPAEHAAFKARHRADPINGHGEGKRDWKPHERSMEFSYLADLALDTAVAQVREALQKTMDAHLETSWRLLAGCHLAFESRITT